MQKIADAKTVSVAQIALAWLLHKPLVTSVIIGAKNSKQLHDNLGAVDVKLDEAEMKQLDQISQLAQEYPGWMLNLPSTRRPGEKRDWSRVAAADQK
jgi:aryl-alcohol dehydrogenase-like predicted oxidoreductase